MAHKLVFLLAVLALVQQATSHSTTVTTETKRQLLAAHDAVDQAQEDDPANMQHTIDADSGTVANQYIVVFKPEAGDAATAAAQLLQEVNTVMAAAGDNAAEAAADPRKVTVLRALGASKETPSPSAAAGQQAGPATGIQAVVLRASPAAVQHIKVHSLVSAAFPDLVVSAQQTATCIDKSYLSAGLTLIPNPAATWWPGCITSATKLKWNASPCPTASNKVQLTSLYAVDKSTNALIMYLGRPCMLYPNPSRPLWTQQRFGSCGVAPTLAKSLPMLICSATGGTIEPGPPNPPLPRTPLAAGEQPSIGVVRIEAVKPMPTGGSNVLDMAAIAAQQPQQVVVGVVDSGVDATHPDLNYRGGATWSMLSLNIPNDVTDPNVDLYGHGTHVAGIIGAVNNGASGPLSVVGVVPGIGIYSLKVLDAQGRGTLSAALDAVLWASGPEGQAKGIKVINLSMAGYADPNGANYATTFNGICSVMKQASDVGVFVTAASGNYGVSLVGYLPASCPTVAAVTSLDVRNNVPSSFSNWLPANATAEDKARVIAAPGGSIVSTISFAKDPTGYRQLSGTSMASPHVAGCAAACILSGACPAAATGADKLKAVQAAAQERLGLPGAAYGFAGDATSSGAKYYGHLVWAGKF